MCMPISWAHGLVTEVREVGNFRAAVLLVVELFSGEELQLLVPTAVLAPFGLDRPQTLSKPEQVRVLQDTINKLLPAYKIVLGERILWERPVDKAALEAAVKALSFEEQEQMVQDHVQTYGTAEYPKHIQSITQGE